MTRTAAEARELLEERNLYPVYQERRSDPQEYIPYDVIAPHEAQALKNHGQTLRRLAERGGLDWGEIWAVLTGRSWSAAAEAGRGEMRAAVLELVSGERKEEMEA